MKNFLLVVAFVLCFLKIQSQCDPQVYVSQTNEAVCFGQPVTIFGYGSGTCPDQTSIQYEWTVTILGPDGLPIPAPQYSQTGQATTLTTIPMFEFFGVEALVEVCLTINSLDAVNNTLGSGEACLANFFYPMPIAINASLTSDACGNMTCVTVMVTGGSSPYIYEWGNGETSSNGVNCLEAPGLYPISVIDANGCIATTAVMIEDFGAENDLCSNALPLENGVVLEDAICTFSTYIPTCSGGQNYYQSGWYSINSEDFSHLSLGAVLTDYPGGINQGLPLAFEVYQEVDGLDCSQAELVYCTNTVSCVDIADEITILPNTNYYIHVVAAWTTIVNVSVLANLSNGSVAGLCGCTDPTSCNYDPAAILNNGSCGWNGCTSAGACNYAAWATCDDGSCIFGTDLTGHIYHDVNGDGFYTTWPALEPSLGNIGYITVEELGVNVYADADGHFVLPELPEAVYHISFVDPSGVWMMADNSSLEITLPTCSGIEVPVLPASEAAAQINGTAWGSSPIIHCTNGFFPGMWIHNTGAVPISGTVTLTLDPLFIATANDSYAPFTDMGGGVYVWNIENQLPGAMGYYMLHINGPGVSYVGQSFPITIEVSLSDSNGNNFFSNTSSANAVVTCAYDPNDKQANPIGYADQHFILEGEEIEYRIRFQNTGNAPAIDVVVEDQLDINHLDLASFQPIVASHSLSTVVDPNGLVKFIFNDIMLPDSTSDEVGSHGFVQYKIRTLPELAHGTIIENTADIYFDENPAVVTNTTFHTIYDCSVMNGLPDAPHVCAGESYELDMLDPYVETYSWSVNDVNYSNDFTLNYSSENPGDVVIALTQSNPLCAVNDVMTLSIDALPGTQITANDWTLTAPAGVQWAWYHNGLIIPEAITQTFTATAEGSYYVITESAEGCVSTSEELMLVKVDEVATKVVSLFPNPMEKEALLSLENGNFEVELFNLIGERLRTWNNAKGSIRIDRAQLSSGVYFLKILGDNSHTETVRLIIK